MAKGAAVEFQTGAAAAYGSLPTTTAKLCRSQPYVLAGLTCATGLKEVRIIGKKKGVGLKGINVSADIYCSEELL